MTRTRFGDNGVPIEWLDVSAYTVPTDSPESDGTYAWDKTTIVIVESRTGGKCGRGYSYADVATAKLIQSLLINVVKGRDALNVPDCWLAMVKSIRNLGRPGIASMAISAVDSALWDLKARLLLPVGYRHYYQPLAYSVLTICITGLYVLVVVSLGTLLRVQDNLLLPLLATGLIAVLFQPLRERLQRVINRLVYGERDSPYMVISLLLDFLDAPNLSIDQPYLDPMGMRSGVGQNVLDDSSGQFSCSLVLLEDN